MKYYHFIVTVALLFVMTTVRAQIRLSDMEPALPDSLQKNQILYFSPGKGGVNRVWDFSRKLRSKRSEQVMFVTDSCGILSVTEPDKINYYRTTPDTLILIGSESPLEKRVYVREKVTKLFPLEYGDSVIMPFRCEGKYCGDHHFREAGTTKVKVDARGSIVLAENDTVRNVLRVHTIDTYSVCMDLDSVALDTAKLTQVIDERYEWYLPESQYPLIEDVTSTTYINMDAIGTTRHAYCNLPEDEVDDYITHGDEEGEDGQQDGFSDEDGQSEDIIHYQVTTQGKTINISYDLDENATIEAIVVNHMGMLYLSRQWTQAAGQGYTMQIECYGLPTGMYILYINVNGKVYSEKVTL